MSTRRVVIVAFPGMQPLDVVGPAEVFHTAARLRPGAYEVTVAAPEREPIAASAVSLMPGRLPGLAPRPGGHARGGRRLGRAGARAR